jgi:hypothetical protein
VYKKASQAKLILVRSILNDFARVVYRDKKSEAGTLYSAAGILQKTIATVRKEYLEMKSAKLSAEHQFILDCAGIMKGRDAGGRSDHEARYEEFYEHIEALGRSLAALVAKYDSPDRLEEYIELFTIGFAPDKCVNSSLEFLEKAFYECGETVQEVNGVMIPDESHMPEPDEERIMEAFRAGVEAALMGSAGEDSGRGE